MPPNGLNDCVRADTMSILLTGGTGYLGSRLLSKLVERPHGAITVVVRKSSNLNRISHLLDRVECVNVEGCELTGLVEARAVDTVIHCATNYGRGSVPFSEIVEANLVLPLKLLDAASNATKRVAFINTDTMLDKNVSAYSMSKKQFGEWLTSYAERGPCVNMVLEHFFGPGDDPTKFASHILRSLLQNEPRIALTEGSQTRDFIYIDDVVSAFLHVLDFIRGVGRGSYEYQIGLGAPLSIRDFVQLAKALSGNELTQLDFGALPHRLNEVMHVCANTESIRLLGWSPRFSVEQGLRVTIEKERG